MGRSQRSRLLRYARTQPFFTAEEVRKIGIHTSLLTRPARDGLIERAGRSRYRLASADITEYHGFALAAAAVPQGVICLLSDLLFHEVGTQLPREVWMATPRGAWKPRVDYSPTHIVHFSGAAFAEGIEKHQLENRMVRIYSLPKTIADCFKCRRVRLALRADLPCGEFHAALSRGACRMTPEHHGLTASVMARIDARAKALGVETNSAVGVVLCTAVRSQGGDADDRLAWRRRTTDARHRPRSVRIVSHSDAEGSAKDYVTLSS